MDFEQIMALHPQPASADRGVLVRCIDACLDCSTSCTACGDASLAEPDVDELLRVIRLTADCAGVCDATRHIVTRQSTPDFGSVGAALRACIAACRTCATECEHHAAHHEHCRLCAEVCRRCAQACEDLLAAIDHA